MTQVSSQTLPNLHIRALYPQPETGESEWVLLEVTGAQSSSISAQVRDTHGSTKTSTFSVPKEVDWFWVYATSSGIALNNDQDSIELLYEGQILDQSATYSASQRGKVWAKLNTGWQWLAQQDFWERLEEHNWLIEQTDQETSTATSSSLVTPSGQQSSNMMPGVEGNSSVSAVMQASQPPVIPYPAKPHQLVALDHPVPTKAEQISYDQPDFAAEEDRYTNWLHTWRQGMFFFASASILWITEFLVQILPRVRKRSWRKITWSLLS